MALLLTTSGCAFRYAGEPAKQEHYCGHRVLANYIGAIHVLASSAAGIVLTNSEGGAGFDVRAAMQLELSWLERIVGGLVAVASMMTLFMFSTRDEEGPANSNYLLTSNVFLACWFVVCITLVFNAPKARETRIRRREWSRQGPGPTELDAAAQAAALANVNGVVLPRTWSFVMISLSCLSFTAPKAIWLLLPHFGSLRGVTGAFANVCFVGHLLMLANNGESSAQQISVGHLAVLILGSVCSFGADARSFGLTMGLALNHLIHMGGTVFELWLWARIMKPTLASCNPTLLAELPFKAFRWLFQRGGLTMAMYCYFEAIGVGFSDRTAEDIEPWLLANSTALTHFTLSAVLSLTLLADSRTSLSTVLRGLAPLYEKVGLAVVFVTSLIALTMFAGREFSARQQQSLYSAVRTSFLLLWIVAIGIMAAGHKASQSQDGTAKVQTLAAPGRSDGNEEDGAASLSELSGGGALTVGI